MGRLRTTKRLLIPLVCFLLLCPSASFLQEAFPPVDSTRLPAPVSLPGELSVEAVVDSPHVPSNQTLTLTVRATCIGDIYLYDFQWPAPPDLDRFEIVGSSSGNIVKKDSDGRLISIREFIYILKPVGQGQGRIGSAMLNYTDKMTGMEHTLSTRPITIDVTGPTVGDSGKLGGAKWFILVLLVLGIGGGVLLLMKKRGSRTEEVGQSLETKGPEERALEQLESVPEFRLAGEMKEYYSAISTILREYIDDRFSLRTMELTTPDIVNHLQIREIDDETRADIEKILNICDMVKFARHEPLPADLDAIYAMARDFFSQRKEEPSGIQGKGEEQNDRS